MRHLDRLLAIRIGHHYGLVKPKLSDGDRSPEEKALSAKRLSRAIILFWAVLPFIGLLSWQIYSHYGMETVLAKGGLAAAHAKPPELVDIRQLLRQALQSAVLIPDLLLKGTTLSDIARAQAVAGDLPGALQTVAMIPDAASQPYAMESIAVVQAQAGDVPGALRTAGAISDVSLRNRAFMSIAPAQARAGDVAGALQTAATLGPSRSIALWQIAVARAEVKDVAGGLQIAAGLTEPFYKAYALLKIAALQAKTGDRTGAGQTRRDALQIAAKIGKSDHLLESIATAQAEAGDVPGALQTAASISDARGRALAFKGIGTAQARAGDRAGAVETLRRAVQSAAAIPRARNAPGILMFIAQSQAEAGDVAGGLQTAIAIADPWNKVSALQAIAVTQAWAGDRTGAARTLAQALQRVGDIEPVGLSKDLALEEITVARARIGDVTAALQIARTISAASARASALQGIAEEQARAGDARGALAWASTEKEPHLKANALLGMAWGLLSKESRRWPLLRR